MKVIRQSPAGRFPNPTGYGWSACVQDSVWIVGTVLVCNGCVDFSPPSFHPFSRSLTNNTHTHEYAFKGLVGFWIRRTSTRRAVHASLLPALHMLRTGSLSFIGKDARQRPVRANSMCAISKTFRDIHYCHVHIGDWNRKVQGQYNHLPLPVSAWFRTMFVVVSASFISQRRKD